MWKTLSFVAVIVLSACTNPREQTIIQRIEKPVVVMPDRRLFRCDPFSYPDPATMTDKELALLLIDMDTKHRICRSNMEKIKRFLSDARKKLR